MTTLKHNTTQTHTYIHINTHRWQQIQVLVILIKYFLEFWNSKPISLHLSVIRAVFLTLFVEKEPILKSDARITEMGFCSERFIWIHCWWLDMRHRLNGTMLNLWRRRRRRHSEAMKNSSIATWNWIILIVYRQSSAQDPIETSCGIR